LKIIERFYCILLIYLKICARNLLNHYNKMKKIFALLFVGTMITFAACQSKPKTEEAAVDSTATTMSTDSAAMSTDSAASTATDSAAVAPADSAK
jgi:hypothetical protein